MVEVISSVFIAHVAADLKGPLPSCSFNRNREAAEHEMEKAKMRMAQRTMRGMPEESEGEDFSAGPHLPEGDQVPMVAYDGPKFKEVRSCVQ